MSITRYTLPHTPTQVEFNFLEYIYPYEIYYYADLMEMLRRFLQNEFPKLPEASVIAISEHNGRGRQWGIVILKFPYQSEWRIVGEFGHADAIKDNTSVLKVEGVWQKRFLMARVGKPFNRCLLDRRPPPSYRKLEHFYAKK